MRKAAALFFLLGSPALAGENRAILFGGNCETMAGGAVRPVNMFLAPMTDAAASLKGSGWNVKPLFDGDESRCTLPASHPDCQASPPGGAGAVPLNKQCCNPMGAPGLWSPRGLESAAGARSRKATTEDLLAELGEAAKMAPGSQLLLHFNTHGAPADGKSAHGLCTDNGMLALGDPRLRAELGRIRARGVKLAFIDESCFSGGSVSALEEFGCVVTAQTENRVSSGHPLTDALSALTGEGRKVTMTDIFTRDLNTPPTYPLNPKISGLKGSDELAEASSRFTALADSGLMNDPAPAYWHRVYDKSHPCVVRTEAQYSDVLAGFAHAVLTDILPRLKASPITTPGLSDLAGSSPEETEKNVKDFLRLRGAKKKELEIITKKLNDNMEAIANGAREAPLPLDGFTGAERLLLGRIVVSEGMGVYGAQAPASQTGAASPINVSSVDLAFFKWNNEKDYPTFVKERADFLMAQVPAPPPEFRGKLETALSRAYAGFFARDKELLIEQGQLLREVRNLNHQIDADKPRLTALVNGLRAAELADQEKRISNAVRAGRPLAPEETKLRACMDFVIK